MGKTLVSDLMTEEVFGVSVNDNLMTVYDIMSDKHVRHVPVVDKGNALLGLVSYTDLVNHALASAQNLPVSSRQALLETVKVSEIMTREVETVGPDQDITEAGTIMLENKFSCLMVTDGDTLAGIITEADFVKHVVDTE